MKQRLTPQDLEDWDRMARTVSRRRSRGRVFGRDLPVAAPFAGPPAANIPVERTDPVAQLLAAAPVRRAAVVRLAPVLVGVQPHGLDTATWERFRSGKLKVDRTLDLHGRTVQAAFHAFERFLARARFDGLRVIEVVTGGGGPGSRGGAIRHELPAWLNLSELRPLLLAAAHPHAANSGSVRLLLRKPRDDRGPR